MFFGQTQTLWHPGPLVAVALIGYISVSAIVCLVRLHRGWNPQMVVPLALFGTVASVALMASGRQAAAHPPAAAGGRHHHLLPHRRLCWRRTGAQGLAPAQEIAGENAPVV